MPPAQIPCPKPLEQLKLLVHHHMSHLYLGEIRARFPRLSLTVLDNYAELRGAGARATRPALRARGVKAQAGK